MSRGKGLFSQFIQQQVKTLQNISDAEIKTLPVSSRYLLAPALSVLASLYATAHSTRKFFYRHGLLWQTAMPSPVISIGNLTNGGTGKTPFVEYLARNYLRSHRFPSLILQRGRGNTDETIMLRQLFEDLPVVVSESTESTSVAKEYLLANPNVRLVLLDDGLQYLPLVRDLEIVMVNALQPLGNGHLVPRGNLLELPKAALRRADAVVLHHADLAGRERMERLHKQLLALAPRHTLFLQTAMSPTSLRSLVLSSDIMRTSLDQSVSTGLGEHVPLSALRGAAVVCLVGIGHPQTVDAHLRRLGAAHVEGCGQYEDHHQFSLEEVLDAVDRVRALQHTYPHACIVMTEKDYARQHNLFDAVFSQYAAETGGGWQGFQQAQEGEGMGEEGGPAAGPDAEVSRRQVPGQQQDSLDQEQEQACSGGLRGPPAPQSQDPTSTRRCGRLAGAAHTSSDSSTSGSSSPGDPSGEVTGQGSSLPSTTASCSYAQHARHQQQGTSTQLSGESTSGVREDSSAGDGGGEGSSGGVSRTWARAVPPWGVYVLQSGLQVVDHDPRFSSERATLSAMLRMAVDNFRQRSYISS